MRLKYYLRGAGVGIIITTLVLTIAFAFQKPSMSDADIIKEAEKLGMVMADDKKTEPTDDGDKKQAKEQDASEPTKDASAEETPKKMIGFTIQRGESSSVVCQRLQEMGLVDDGAAFDKYLSQNGEDNLIQPGEYSISEGATYEQIANTLTKK